MTSTSLRKHCYFLGLVFVLWGPPAPAAPFVVDPSRSLSWWLLPDREEELPHHVEYDVADNWKEIWARTSSEQNYSSLQEQLPGLRWSAFDPDPKTGAPTQIFLVFNNRIVEIKNHEGKSGVIDGNLIKWNGGLTQSLYEFRRRRARHGRRQKRVGFGKIVLPKEVHRETVFPKWMMVGFDGFLKELAEGRLSFQGLASVSKLASAGQSSLLNMEYAENCSLEDRLKIENWVVSEVEPKLTCLALSGDQTRTKLVSVLLQNPMVSCRAESPMPKDACGMATLPVRESFFLARPQINLAFTRCPGEEARTLLHEFLHLFGFSDKDESLEKAELAANSCENRSHPPILQFDAPDQTFVNDFQVQARFVLFNIVRNQSESKWGWSAGERAFVLGSLCAQSTDSLCARRYFAEAAQHKLGGEFLLADGASSSYYAAAAFGLFDSIKEDRQRMHEFLHYLHRDPKAVLVKRRERESYKSHEYYVIRTALEKVKENKNVCDEEIDERVSCEDLSELARTQWFMRD